MPAPFEVLTPEALALLRAVARAGSFAAAARDQGLVPSAVTYRIRQIEDALDVLLFDRSSRQARLTPAGAELLREGARLLAEIDAVANRVKRVATGWESQLTIAVDTVISSSVVMELVQAFYEPRPVTRLRLRDESLSGTLEALTSGQADLALGVALEPSTASGVQSRLLGDMPFVFAVAPHHPLAGLPEPLSDELLQQHRAIAVADSVQRGTALTLGLLAGQDVLTVPTMRSKLDAQLRGLGAGFVPEAMARPYLETGRLVRKETQRGGRVVRISCAWRTSSSPGRGLQWWLGQLESAATRRALIEQHRMPQ
ncbi:LysR substrate-binding domain-containing protein [Ramlibacter sp.]|uniref:LysR substrate-binding domain-containing protein n=1 Tax=Ramlibacter sp. TaxID=1917967 RepID=UPI002B8A3390|nr:LysR substrate-binding domain-containing protein [Ramlibacter sp.]HWI80924.1 LysR substrate-binding domain-containing protein [Ramlibacter sp.]